jgi:PAS domain S-box-containing protein
MRSETGTELLPGPSHPQQSQPTSTKLKVLHLEDRPADAELALLELRHAGYAPDWKRVETEADYVAQLDQDWDLILADYHLPQFDGLRALRLLRERRTDLPFILVSGAIGEEMAVAAMRAGANDYVMKDKLARLGPAVERELREAVGRREHRQAEANQQLALAALQLLNRPNDLFKLVGELMWLIESTLGYAAVGLRVRQGEDFPYYVQNGFPDGFVRMEDSLCAKGEDATILRDAGGQPVLECTCGLVLSGRTDPSLPCFTPGGSFWTNQSADLLALAPEADPRTHPRNRCIHAGYASVALIPLRSGGEIIGLLQLNDQRPGRFTPELIRFLEGLAASIGIALKRRQDQAKLDAKGQQLRTLIDNLPDSIYVKDMEGRFLVANVAVALRVGAASPQALIGHTDADFHPPELAARYRADEVQVLRDGRALQNREEQVRTAAGELRWSSTTMVPLMNDAGAVIGLVGIGRDITELKHALEAHVRLVTAVEQAAETVMITDPDGTICYVNPAFERITGYTPAEALGQNPRLLKSGKQDAAFYQKMWRLLVAKQVWRGHFINKRKDGTLYEEVATISPVLDAAGEVVNHVAVKRDVTREVELEMQYRQAAKMSAVGQLAGGVAHDFNNKLQVIQGYAGVATEKLPPDHPVQADLREILVAVLRSADLTRQLLAFSRQQTITPVVMDLNAAVAGSLRMLGRLVNEDIRLNLEASPGLWRVLLDPGQVDQLLANLVVNARDAITGAGRISISTANCTFSKADCQDSPDSVQPGDFVALKISDDGSGMTPEIRARIFEPFFTTKGVGEGTGMGLATVHGIVKQNNGYIEVWSEPNQGTAFTIYLPRHPDESPQELAEAAVLPSARGETVLLVEDELPLLNIVSHMLVTQGYTVLSANTPDEAIRLAGEHPGAIQLLISDVIMPNLNGRELAEALLKTHPHLKLLFMSGYPADIIARKGVLHEGVHFIQKPFSLHTLATKVREVLDKPER